ncbi:MAG: patatin-like phospholipase family protein [Vicinamibacterales bacterium]
MSDRDHHYSPERRTALVLTGTGVDGAYHAGVLRALDEAGVKIDLVAGRGIGAVGAVYAAVDGASRLWDQAGLWRQPAAARLYQWRWPLRVLGWLLAAIGVVFAVPLLFVALAILVYPVGLALGMAGLEAGHGVITAYVGVLADAFGPGGLPTWLPRAMAVLVGMAALILAGGTLAAWWQAPIRRTARGNPLWALIGAPLDAGPAIQHFTRGVWDLLKGGAPIQKPDLGDLSRRYTELLAENLGHPGFRELLLVAHDLDARRDLVFGLVREPFRRTLFPPPGAQGPRPAEAFDLAGLASDHAIDALSGALTIPGMTEPRLVRFAPDSFWRGEAHRLQDRPGSLLRLLEETAAAGAEQVIIVGASPDLPVPHALVPPRIDAWGRLNEQAADAETLAFGEAVLQVQRQFRGVYPVRPGHNPVAPFDLAGTHDVRSDRAHATSELVERGYEDAYRQFIDPIVGAAGERLQARASRSRKTATPPAPRSS